MDWAVLPLREMPDPRPLWRADRDVAVRDIKQTIGGLGGGEVRTRAGMGAGFIDVDLYPPFGPRKPLRQSLQRAKAARPETDHRNARRLYLHLSPRHVFGATVEPYHGQRKPTGDKIGQQKRHPKAPLTIHSSRPRGCDQPPQLRTVPQSIWVKLEPE